MPTGRDLEREFLQALARVVRSANWHYFSSDGVISGTDCLIMSPHGSTFLVEWKVGTGALHFSAIKNLDVAARNFSRRPADPHGSRESVGVLATSQTISKRMLATVASSSNVLLFTFSPTDAVEDVCRSFLDFCISYTSANLHASVEPANDISIAEINELKTSSAHGDTEAATRQYRELIRKQENAVGPDHPTVMTSRLNFARMLKDRGEFTQSEQELQRLLTAQLDSLGSSNSLVLATRTTLASLLLEMGRADDAEHEMREVLQAEIEHSGAEHISSLEARQNLAALLAQRGSFQEAELEYKVALRSAERVLGYSSPTVLANQIELAKLLFDQGKLEEVEDLLRLAVATQTRSREPDYGFTLWARELLARVLQYRGRVEEARAAYRDVLDRTVQIYGSDHPIAIRAKDALASDD